jgi:nucleotide-binding universal stress UspA family protein
VAAGPLLVCYDGSDGAKAALAAAAAAFAGSEALVACYWQPFAASSKRFGLDLRELVQDADDINRREEALAAALAEDGTALARAAGLDAHAQPVEIDCPIEEAILAHADELDAAVIVLGSRSRSTIRSLLLGSTANEIVQRAPRPVYLAPSPALAARRNDQLVRDDAEAAGVDLE